MIVVRLLGGLGNQMFQYAAALALAEHKHVALKADLRDLLKGLSHHGFELNQRFALGLEAASEAELAAFLGWRRYARVRRWLERPAARALRGRRFVVQPHIGYWSGLFDAPADAYLLGYWQSEKYFQTVADRVRRAFTFAEPLHGRNAEMAEHIRSCEAVAIHVRRGDYVYKKETAATHGSCPMEYYERAIDLLDERLSCPEYFVFSDDPHWIRSRLAPRAPCHFVDWNTGARSFEDLRLMSLCRHQVIANSTFSWWAAWLNANPEKTVIAPRRWFADASRKSEDLVPETWLRL